MTNGRNSIHKQNCYLIFYFAAQVNKMRRTDTITANETEKQTHFQTQKGTLKGAGPCGFHYIIRAQDAYFSSLQPI